MAQSHESPRVVLNVIADVENVDESRILLTSPMLEPGSWVVMSSVMAHSLFYGSWEGTKTNLTFEFGIGDRMKLDLYRDQDEDGQYNPIKIHSIRRHRVGGLRINALGLIINIRTHEYVIRSAELPHDITCALERLHLPPDCEVAVGRTVAFEAICESDLFCESDVAYFQCVEARMHPPTVDEVGFTYYQRVRGMVIKDAATDSFRVQFSTGCALPKCILAGGTLPIAEFIFEDDCFVEGILGQYLSCLVCAQRPNLGQESTFEVVYVEPLDEPVWLPAAERIPSEETEEGGFPLYEGKHGHRFVQCCENYNEDVEEAVRDMFLFSLEHARPEQFEDLIHKYPRLTQVLSQVAGLEPEALEQPDQGNVQVE